MNNASLEIFESSLLREKYFKHTHASGLEIYVFPKKLSSTYAIIGTRYGAIDNSFCSPSDNKTITVPDGIAHFLEHKLFANEDGSDSFEHFSAFGADANAYTSFTKTAYLFSCTDNLEPSLSELIDFVTHPYFTEDAVKKEIGIIAQEIKMYDDNPGEVCYYNMLRGLYEKHSIRRNICGSVRSISKITPELLYECYRVFYDLSNMTLVVCGDVSPEEIIRIANARLTKERLSSRPERANENDLEAPAAFIPEISKNMQVSKPLFSIGIKDTSIPKDPYERIKRDAAMSILNEMLFSRAGALYSDLFENGMISPDLSYGYTIHSTFAFNSIAGEADDPKAVLEIIKKYIRTAQKKGLSSSDFDRCRRVMYADFVKDFDSTEAIANSLLDFAFNGTDIFSYTDALLGITLDDIEKLLGEVFLDEFFTLSVIYPLNAQNERK